MGVMKKQYFFFMFLLTLVSCAKGSVAPTPKTGYAYADRAKELSYAYDKADKRKERLAISAEGIDVAAQCIQMEPQNPACYYFHALNVGNYYQSKVIGYQDGLKVMIADSEKLITLDPSFEYGGGYRILGTIYTEVPPVSVARNGITRDTEKAIAYLIEAINHGPDYPENYLALSQAYQKTDNDEQAVTALKDAKLLMKKWKNHPDYPYWEKLASELTKKLD